LLLDGMVNMLKGIYKSIRENHGLMMAVCCGVPLILLAIAVYFLGLSRSYLFWFIILLCPLMHYLMMMDMHKKSSSGKEDGKCH